MNTLCTLCARGGSKGVKNKNIRMLLDKPLIVHSIEQARESGLFKAIAVSSDSEAILDVAAAAGVDFLVQRPLELAGDNAGKLPAIKHCVQQAEQMAGWQADVFVDLDATSPLRTVGDIRDALELLITEQVSNVITGAPARRSPYFNLVELDRDSGHVSLSKSLSMPVLRRQDVPVCYDMNASIYVWRRDVFMQNPAVFYDDTLLFEMPEQRSLDIDSELDFEIVEFLMNRQRCV